MDKTKRKARSEAGDRISILRALSGAPEKGLLPPWLLPRAEKSSGLTRTVRPLLEMPGLNAALSRIQSVMEVSHERAERAAD